MHRFHYMALATIALSLAYVTAAAANLSPSNVMSQPAQYNGQEITVSGTIEYLKATVSHRGNAYETFKLCDNKDCLNAFTWGTTLRNDGAQVTVSGHFWQVKHVGRYTFYNELDLDNGQ